MRLLLALLTAVVIATPPSPGLAQGSPPAAVSPAEVARLSDEEVRRLLLERLVSEDRGGAAEAPFNPAFTAYALQRELGRAQARAGEIARSFPDLARLPGAAWARMMRDRDAGAFGGFLLVFALAIAAGVAADLWLRARLERHLPAPPPLAHPPLGNRAAAALAGLAVETARLAGFAAAAAAVFFVLGADDARDRTAFVFYLTAAAIVKAAAAAARTWLAPDRPEARIPAFADADARALYRAVLRTVGFGAFGFFTCALIAALGLAGDSHTLLLILVGTATTLLLTHSLWAARLALAGDIAVPRHEPGRLRRTVAGLLPGMLVLFAPLLWTGLVLAALTGRTPLFGAALYSLFLLLALPSADSALWRQGRALAQAGQPGLAAGLRVGRLGLIVLAFLSLTAAWRIDLMGFASDSMGAGAASAMLQILVTLFMAYAVWQALGIWIDRMIAGEDRRRAEELGGADDDFGEQGGTGHSRLRTLLPILRRAAQIMLWVLVTMIALGALGVDTGPLLAGAGVVGLAIGFGSQALVRDVVSGFFFLIEDAFRLGEYLDVGEAMGTVEEISVRSMKLRHHRGALNTVPFGSVNIVKNYSRDWAIMKFKVRVPFETDLNMVRKLLKQTGQKMLEIEAIRDDFLQPFKSQGAVDVDDHGFIISTKFMSKPGRQWVIRRYAFQALQEAFEEQGIPWARPEIKVRVEGVGDDDRRQAIQAAAGGGAHAAAGRMAADGKRPAAE
jgi:small-conductance mechanosensitive channel